MLPVMSGKARAGTMIAACLAWQFCATPGCSRTFGRRCSVRPPGQRRLDARAPRLRLVIPAAPWLPTACSQHVRRRSQAAARHAS
jgi:hypothetical protein